MNHVVELTETAWEFVMFRRVDREPGEYVSMVLENLAVLSGEGYIPAEGSIVEIVEGAHEIPKAVDRGSIAEGVMGYLRAAFPEKIPKSVFIKKCADRGLSYDEKEKALKKYEISLK
jgi:hypothetical protein